LFSLVTSAGYSWYSLTRFTNTPQCYTRPVTSMNEPSHIVVVGSANIAGTIFADEFLRRGETIGGRELHPGFGAKRRQSRHRRLSCVALHGSPGVSDALFGTATIQTFAHAGLDVGRVVITRCFQGSSMLSAKKQFQLISGSMSSGVAPIFVDGAALPGSEGGQRPPRPPDHAVLYGSATYRAFKATSMKAA